MAYSKNIYLDPQGQLSTLPFFVSAGCAFLWSYHAP